MLQQLSAEELPKVEKEIIDFIATCTTHEELKKACSILLKQAGNGFGR